LQAKNVFVKLLKVNYAFHSPQMEPFLPELVQSLEGLQPSAPKLAVYSTSRGELSQAGDYNGSYWGREVREPVLFASAAGKMIQDGFKAFVEIGPHPVLSPDILNCFNENRQACCVLYSLHRKE